MKSLRIKASELFRVVNERQERVVVEQGGTSSGKTILTLQILILKALQEENILISVVAESLPHLKRGAMRDFFKLLIDYEVYHEKHHNKTDNSYKFQTGSVIEFFGADQPDKLRGARRDYLFINECNNVAYESFNQLEVRTKKQIYLDFNPTAEFWAHTKLIGNEGVYFVKSTYLDNPFLDDTIIKSIETRKETDPYWWKVYGLGDVGVVEGVIFPFFNIVDSIPPEANLLGTGVDFGYTNDPTAIVQGYLFNNEIYLNELIYKTGLSNRDIWNEAKPFVIPTNPAFADSAEPKSIDELYYLGWSGIKPVVKGADSIRNGIQVMKQYKINVSKNSINLIKELRNYRWATDKFGNTLSPEKPIDNYNHILDATRYLIFMTLGAEQNKKVYEIDIF